MSKRDYYEILEVSRDATDQEIKSCVSQARAEVPPGSQPGRQDRRREVQGGRRGVRGARRRRQARALRPFRSRRRFSGRRAGLRPVAASPSFDDIFGSLGDIFGFGGGGRRGRARSAAPIFATTSRSSSSSRPRASKRPSRFRGTRRCETCKGSRRRARHLADDVSAVPRHRPAALSAGVLHRRADVRPMPRRRQGDHQAVPDLPRRRHHRADAQADREDSRRASPPGQRLRLTGEGEARHARRALPAISTSSSSCASTRSSSATATICTAPCRSHFTTLALGGEIKVPSIERRTRP